jgi:hypothetical protein
MISWTASVRFAAFYEGSLGVRNLAVRRSAASLRLSFHAQERTPYRYTSHEDRSSKVASRTFRSTDLHFHIVRNLVIVSTRETFAQKLDAEVGPALGVYDKPSPQLHAIQTELKVKGLRPLSEAVLRVRATA